MVARVGPGEDAGETRRLGRAAGRTLPRHDRTPRAQSSSSPTRPGCRAPARLRGGGGAGAARAAADGHRGRPDALRRGRAARLPAAAATLDGEDPTTQEGLQRAYERREMKVRAATFSNLYPATTGVCWRPWPRAPGAPVTLWRWLLLLGVVAGGRPGSPVRGRTPAGRGDRVGRGDGLRHGECVAPARPTCCGRDPALLGLSRGGGRPRRPSGGGGIVVPRVAGVRWPGGGGGLLGGRAGPRPARPHLRAVPLDRFVSGIQGRQVPGRHLPGSSRPRRRLGWASSATCATPRRWSPWPSWGRRPGGDAPRRRSAGRSGGRSRWRPPGSEYAAGFHILYAPLYIPAVAWVATGRSTPPPPAGRPRGPGGRRPGPPVGLGPSGRPRGGAHLAGLLAWGPPSRGLAPPPAGAGPGPRGRGRGLGWLPRWRGAMAPRARIPRRSPRDVTGLGLPEGVGHGGPQPGVGVPLPDATLSMADPAQLASPPRPAWPGPAPAGCAWRRC